MRKLILEEWLSLDGYVADSNGGLDFFTAPDLNKQSDLEQVAFMQTVDAILIGRKTYELFVDFWPSATTEKEPIADQLNNTEKFVFSSSLQKAPWGKWPEAQIVTGDVATAIKKMKAQSGKNMVMWGSISIAQELMEKNLVDEYHFRICPSGIGSGRPFFPGGKAPVNFKLDAVTHYDSGLVFLKYLPI